VIARPALPADVPKGEAAVTQTPPRTPSVPPEHLLLRFGLLTLDQLNAALREQNATGTPFTEILVRDGVVGADDLARALGEAPTAPPVATAEPPTVSLAPPVSLPAPLPAELEPEPQAPPVYVVRGRLVNGEDVEVATVEDAAEAQRIALDAMRACARGDGADWPVLNGRYVRPEAIVAIDVVERV
jgi:hypothetical protein